jgi:uncharacterized protein YidB (DUF937 family)
MGLFDDLVREVGSAVGGAQHQGVAQALLGMLGGKGAGTIPGGLSGLAQRFQQKGLGDMMSSWISSGPNPPISAQQVEQVLGGDVLAALASKVGIPPEAAASAVAKVLPLLVDKLTPQGSIPSGDSLFARGLEMLEGSGLFGS